MSDAQYFGLAPTSLRDVESRYEYTAIASQTNFAALYEPGYVDVYLNGSHVPPSALTATNGTTVTLATPTTAGDNVVIVSRRQVEYVKGIECIISSVSFTATTGQTSFPLTYQAGTVFSVTRNGIDIPFSASTGTSITISTAANVGDVVKAYYFTSFSATNAISKGGDTVAGNIDFTGTVTFPTQTTATSNTSAATTAFVQNVLSASLPLYAKLATSNSWTAAQAFSLAALTDASSITWDCGVAQVATLTLAGSRTMSAPTNVRQGALYILRVTQDTTGSRVLTWDSSFHFGTQGAPTLTTTASKTDLLTFIGGASNTLEFLSYRLNAV